MQEDPPKAELRKDAEVIEVKSVDELKNIMKQWPAVVVDFWASWCAPSISFRDTFQQHCSAMSDDNLIFCSIQIDMYPDAAAIWDVITVPCYAFFCNNKEINRITEANGDLLLKNISDLQSNLVKKTDKHAQMEYKQFKVTSKKPLGFTSIDQSEQIKECLQMFFKRKHVGIKSTDLLQEWAKTCNFNLMCKQTIDQLTELTMSGEIFEKTLLLDIYRLIVLDESTAEYVFSKHWDELIDICLMGYLNMIDLDKPDDKELQKYHMQVLKVLVNAFQTSSGQKIILEDASKGSAVIQFCTKSFKSADPKVVQCAAVLLFDYMLCCADSDRSKREKQLLLKDSL